MLSKAQRLTATDLPSPAKTEIALSYARTWLDAAMVANRAMNLDKVHDACTRISDQMGIIQTVIRK